MKWLKKNRDGLIVGIVSSILFTLLLKISKNILALPPEKWYSFFQNYLYKLAAKQTNASISEHTLVLIITVSIGALIPSLIKSFQIVNETNIIIRMKETNATDKPTEELSDEEIKLIRQYNKIKRKANKSVKGEVKEVKRGFFVILILLIMIMAIAISCFYYPWAMWKTFQLDIIQISPYTDETVIKMLKSKWVSMDEKKEYIEIYDQINSIKLENGFQITN